MPQPLRDKTEARIEACGAKRVLNTRVRKYHVWTHPTRPGIFIYLGKSGAIRVGSNVSQSISVLYFSDKWLQALEAELERNSS